MKRDNTMTKKNAKLRLKQGKKGKEIKENKHYLFLVVLSSHAHCTTCDIINLNVTRYS